MGAVKGQRPMITEPGNLKWLDGSPEHEVFAQRTREMCRAAGIFT
jgi:hypothetical protein